MALEIKIKRRRPDVSVYIEMFAVETFNAIENCPAYRQHILLSPKLNCVRRTHEDKGNLTNDCTGEECICLEQDGSSRWCLVEVAK